MVALWSTLTSTSASEWWPRQFDLTLSTHSVCTLLEDSRTRWDLSDLWRSNSLAFVASRSWSSNRRTSSSSSLMTQILMSFCAIWLGSLRSELQTVLGYNPLAHLIKKHMQKLNNYLFVNFTNIVSRRGSVASITDTAKALEQPHINERVTQIEGTEDIERIE